MPVLAMPRLSDTMEDGTIVAWLVQPGAAVAIGDELVEIESDKATMTIQAELEGPLTVLAAEGDAVVVGAPIAWIGADAPDPDGGEDSATGAGTPAGGVEVVSAAGAPDGDAGLASVAPGDAGVSVNGASAAPGDAGPAEEIAASPVARRVARRLGVDLGAVAGSGPRGRVLKADVEAHAAGATGAIAVGGAAGAGAAREPGGAAASGVGSPSGSDPRGTVDVVPLTRIQRTIADRMVTAKAAPEFVVEVDVDLSRAVALRAELKAEAADGDPVPSFNDFVIRAAALALRDHPEANAAYAPDGFQRFSRVNVGVAVAAEGTLVVPTVFDADRKSLAAVATDVRRLAAKVRDGAIEPADLSGGTFTVSNLGMFGVDRFVAVLNPPQAAILAVGRMVAQPVWDDATDAFVPRPTVRLTLTCDHRILYGADAARLLGRIRERLERPLLLAL